MDHSLIRQTFKFENNFSTVGKSFPNLVKLWSLVLKYCKMSKYSDVKFANCVHFCIMREKALPPCTFPHSCNAFPCVIQRYANSKTLQDYIFHILQYFATKLDSCTKFGMLFPAMLIYFANSKVWLIGERSIPFLCVVLTRRLFNSPCFVK